jgi:tRNA-binding protein
MVTIKWEDFEKVELRVGTIVAVEEFPQARTPAYIVKADFGDDLGIKKASAQITRLYTKEALVGMQIIGVLNLPPKQIGPIRSEFLVTGFVQGGGEVVLAVPESDVPNGLKLL